MDREDPFLTNPPLCQSVLDLNWVSSGLLFLTHCSLRKEDFFNELFTSKDFKEGVYYKRK
jgi:hypothetical protein